VLEELRISGLGVIGDAVLEFSPGLTVVTGETGAGKTMVVTGLGLLFGGRADAGLVRSGSARAAVDGRVTVLPGGAVANRVDELGGDLERDPGDERDADVRGQTLLLSRVVGADGRSRAQLAGRSVPVGTLAEIADELIAVHGQTDQLRLRAPARQRDSIDRFGGRDVGEPLGAYQEVYRKYLDVETTLGEIMTRARDRAREADVLRFGLAEIQAAAPQKGEDFALTTEVGRLSHSDLLRSAAMSAHAGLLGDPAGDDIPDAVGLVAGARAALERVADHDTALKVLAGRLAEAGYLLSDVAAELAAYADDIESDPIRLAAAQDRQAVLAGLVRKYGAGDRGVDGVLEWAQEAAVRMLDLENDDARVAELAAESKRLHAAMATHAQELSAARRRAASTFGELVTTELQDLAMPHAVVTVEVRTGDTYGTHGADDIEILLMPHAGAPARSLAKGASGGELSRVMLAVEVVFGGADPVPTLVFDEVDAGVGGRAAVEVGRRLARLARVAQVIVVTHLPQVAAFADRHLVVVKSDDGTVTSSGVVALDDSGRVNELSRMLAGLEGSALAQGHAGELLATASGYKRDL
jgi:DNA repair protein RecN (Recombination protein N)